MDNILKAAYAIPHTATNPLRDACLSSINLTLDLLDGCAYHCDGCFVQRRNKADASDLSEISMLVDQWEDRGFGFNETFIGPTDVFSANNFDVIFKNEDFRQLGEHFTFACISTLLDDYDKIARRVEVMQEYQPNWRGRGFEVFVMVDIEKFFVNRDEEYMKSLWKKLSLFNLDDIFFTINVDQAGKFSQLMNLAELNEALMTEFSPPAKDCTTGLRINPSFFRSNNVILIQDHARALRDALRREITPDNPSSVYSNMINIYANATTFHDYTYRNHELYVAPFIYENIPVTDEMFHIPRNEDGFWTQDDFDAKHRELFVQQSAWASRSIDCYDCANLPTCMSRHILSYMETRSLRSCFLPKELLKEPGENANAVAQCLC